MVKDTDTNAAAEAALDEAAIWNEADTQEAAPVAAAEPAPEPEAPPAAPEPPAPAADPWATAPEPLRNQYAQQQRELEELRQRYRSQEGRVSAYQRRYEELRAQLDSEAQAAVAPPAKAEPKRQEPTKPEELDAELAELAESYPEIGGTIKKLFEAVRQETVTLSEAQRQVLERHHQREENALAEMHPDWRDVVTGNNQPVFALWLQRQPEDVQRAAIANGYTIEDSKAAARVIGAFKDFISAQNQPAPRAAEPPPPSQSSKRARQLAGAETVKTRGQQAFTPGIPEDAPEADIWDAIERVERARRSAAS
jgi:hypothetical protein